MTCWNSMKFGVLYWKRSINAGCGLQFAEEHGRLSLLLWETAVRKPAAVSGGKSLLNTKTLCCTATSGKPIKKYCLKISTKPLERKVDRLIIWNAGIAHFVNVYLAMSARHSHFLNPTHSITWSPNGLSTTTTSPSCNSHHLLYNHYRVFPAPKQNPRPPTRR